MTFLCSNPKDKRIWKCDFSNNSLCDIFSILKVCQLRLQISRSILEKNPVLHSGSYKCLGCVHEAELRCRHGVWELNTFRVSLVPFHIGEGRSFSLIMGPSQPDSFKGVHSMHPQAPNIFRRALCRMKKRHERVGS